MQNKKSLSVLTLLLIVTTQHQCMMRDEIKQTLLKKTNMQKSITPLEIVKDHITDAQCSCSRPAGSQIKYIVLHDMKCDAAGAKETFRTLGVSAHYFVERSGIVQEYIPVEKKAYHAGYSKFGEDVLLSNTSIGIEHEGLWGSPPSETQLNAIIHLVKYLKHQHPSIERILSHGEIAPYRTAINTHLITLPPEEINDSTLVTGKIDPGIFFPWKTLAKEGIGLYPHVTLSPSPQILGAYGDKNKTIQYVQNKLYDHGYTLMPRTGIYDKKTAAVLHAFYLRYYQDWFFINKDKIKNAIIENHKDKNDTVMEELLKDPAFKCLDQETMSDRWIYDRFDYLPASNIDDNTLKIIEALAATYERRGI